MKAGTIMLLLLVVIVAVACSKTSPKIQGATNVQEDSVTSNTDNVTLVIDDLDSDLETELASDPLEEVGTLDEIPIDDSIPE